MPDTQDKSIHEQEAPRSFSDAQFTARLNVELARLELANPSLTKLAEEFLAEPPAHAVDIADAWIYGLYLLMFKRLPDPVGYLGFRVFLQAGNTPADLAERLTSADEGQLRHAKFPSPLPRALVVGSYLLALRRTPTAAEMEAHLTAIARGESADSVYFQVLASEESGLGGAVNREPDAVSIARAYQEVMLGRAPRADLTDILATRFSQTGSVMELGDTLRPYLDDRRSRWRLAVWRHLGGREHLVELRARIRQLELALRAAEARERFDHPPPQFKRPDQS